MEETKREEKRREVKRIKKKEREEKKRNQKGRKGKEEKRIEEKSRECKGSEEREEKGRREGGKRRRGQLASIVEEEENKNIKEEIKRFGKDGIDKSIVQCSRYRHLTSFYKNTGFVQRKYYKQSITDSVWRPYLLVCSFIPGFNFVHLKQKSMSKHFLMKKSFKNVLMPLGLNFIRT